MGTIKKIIISIQNTLTAISSVRSKIPNVKAGNKAALMKQLKMLELRLNSQLFKLKDYTNTIEVTVIVDINGKLFKRTYYGIHKEDVKELVTIQLSLTKMTYNIIEITEKVTEVSWEELFYNKEH